MSLFAARFFAVMSYHFMRFWLLIVVPANKIYLEAFESPCTALRKYAVLLGLRVRNLDIIIPQLFCPRSSACILDEVPATCVLSKFQSVVLYSHPIWEAKST